jgi:hypothetical protein
MRRIKNGETAKLVMDGWLVHYNFFRPSEVLNGRTPAETAGVKVPFGSWAEVVGGQLWQQPQGPRHNVSELKIDAQARVDCTLSPRSTIG